MLKNLIKNLSMKYLLAIIIAIVGVTVVLVMNLTPAKADTKNTPDVYFGITGSTLVANSNTTIVTVPTDNDVTLQWVAYRRTPLSNGVALSCVRYNFPGASDKDSTKDSYFLSGTYHVGHITSQQTYFIYCYDDSSGVAQWAGVTIKIANQGPVLSATLSSNSATGNYKYNDNLTLGWEAPGASNCNIVEVNTANNYTMANFAVTQLPKGTIDRGAQTISGTFKYTLTCSNSSGTAVNTVKSSITITVGTPPVAQPPTINYFKANDYYSPWSFPLVVPSGTSVTLSWSITGDISTCNGSSIPTNAKFSGYKISTTGATGSINIGSLSANTKFSLSCKDINSYQVEVDVASSTPKPTVKLNANPVSVDSGGSTALTWSTTNATSCAAIGYWTGTKDLSGSETIKNITSMSNFGMECKGPGGTTSASSVTVNVKPSIALTADLKGNGQDGTITLNTGDNYTLTGKSNASYCEVKDQLGIISLAIENPTNWTYEIGPYAYADDNVFTMTCYAGSDAKSQASAYNSSGQIALSGIEIDPRKMVRDTVGVNIGDLDKIIGDGPKVTFKINGKDGSTDSSGSPAQTVKAGEKVIIEWTVQGNVKKCTATSTPLVPSWQGDLDAPNKKSDKITIDSISENTLFEIGCINPDISVFGVKAAGKATHMYRKIDLLGTVPAPSEVNLTADPVKGDKDTKIKLEWSTKPPANYCVSSWDKNKKLANKGDKTVKLTSSDEVEYIITCVSEGGIKSGHAWVNQSTTPPPIAPNASITLTAVTTNTKLQLGESTKLHYIVNNATSCEASSTDDSWKGPVTDKIDSLDGAYVDVTPKKVGDVVYTLKCTNKYGVEGEPGIVTVTVINKVTPPPPTKPTVTLSMNPQSIKPNVNTIVALSWHSNGESCTASGGTLKKEWGGTKNPNGDANIVVNAPIGVYTYTMICSNAGGSSVPASVSLKVETTASVTTAKVYGEVFRDKVPLAGVKVGLFDYSDPNNPKLIGVPVSTTTGPVKQNSKGRITGHEYGFDNAPLGITLVTMHVDDNGKPILNAKGEPIGKSNIFIAPDPIKNEKKQIYEKQQILVDINEAASVSTGTTTAVNIAAVDRSSTGLAATRGNVTIAYLGGGQVFTGTTDQTYTFTKDIISKGMNFTAMVTNPNQPGATPVVINFSVNGIGDSVTYNVVTDSSSVGCQEHDNAGVKIYYCGATAISNYNNSKYASVWTDISTTLNNLKTKYNFTTLPPVYINSDSKVSDDYQSGSTNGNSCPPTGEKFEITTGLIDKAFSTTSNYMTYLFGVRKDFLNYGGCNWASEQAGFTDNVSTLMNLTADTQAYTDSLNEQNYYPTMNISSPVTNQEIYASLFHIKNMYAAQLLTNIKKGSSSLLSGFNQLIVYTLATSKK
jgi:hypothetical protein